MRPPVIENIVMREEGKVLAVGREAEVLDGMLAVENLSDRILHLAHSLRRQPAYDGKRGSVRSKVRSLHIGDFWFGSAIFCEGPRQVARSENRRQPLQGKRHGQLTPRRHRQQASVFDAESDVLRRHLRPPCKFQVQSHPMRPYR